MNIYQRLLNILAESIVPEYWSESELQRFLDLAQQEFVIQARFLRKHSFLFQKFNINDTSKTLTFDNSYMLPDDLLSLESVQWNGKPLDKKSLRYIETRFSGTSHQQELSGVGRAFESDWRTDSGSPEHWVFDNGCVLLYPNASEQPATVLHSLADAITNDNPFVDLSSTEFETRMLCFYQYKSEVVNSSLYEYTGSWGILRPGDFAYCKSSGWTYAKLSDRFLAKVKQLNSDGVSMILMSYFPSKSVSADYVYKPFIRFEDLFAPDGVPHEVPSRYDEAIVSYAAYLALSKEGSKTQDLEKAQIYLNRFNEYIKRDNLSDSAIDIDDAVRMPCII